MTKRQGRGRIFLPPSCFFEKAVSFPGEEERRLRKVLRLTEGDEILITDGGGSEYLVRLGRKGGTVVDERRPRTESALRTTLVQALPKAEKLEYLVQKAVELGVSEIRPVTSRRSVASVRDERWRKRRLRLEKIAAAAVAQSGRTVLPAIADPEPWESFTARPANAGLKLICREGAAPMLDEAALTASSPESAVIAVGPEGGWSDDEVSRAEAAGYRPFSLGPRILRTETAGVAALALLQYRFGDMGGQAGG